jgi:ATP-dependent Clp protease ATP-binding subunit ClpX
MATTTTNQLPAVLRNIPTPARLKLELDKYVIGQEEAKKTLCVAVYNHYRRLQLIAEGTIKAQDLQKSNVLLTGMTGSGKTHLVKTIARLLNIPCYIQDCTKITASGYVGSDVEDCVVGLLRNCNYDVAKAEMGIVMLDEIDKNRKAEAGVSVTRDVSGECVQQSLLKIIEGGDGSKLGVAKNGGRKRPDEPLIYIDTSQILFVASGAFVDLENIISHRLGRNENSIGFSGKNAKKSKSKESVLSQLLPEDLHKYGMIPEFVGRFPIYTTTEPLDQKDLVRILTEPKDAIVKQYQSLLAMDGINLTFTAGALDAIADRALKLGTGARALRNIMERVLRDTMFDAPSYKYKGLPTDVVVTETMVRERTRMYQNVG